MFHVRYSCEKTNATTRFKNACCIEDTGGSCALTTVHMRTIDDITKEQRTKRGIALLVALFWFWVSTLPLPVSEQKRVDHNNGGVSVNDAQRQKIIQLRQAGQSFAQIADKVCLPKSTVKSFCYRHTASADDVKQEPRSTVCPQCGKPLPERRFKPRRFCSDECRAKYWAVHGDQIVRRSAVDMTCPVCHRHFHDYAQRHRKYCSHACYIAARYHGGIPHD